ncbi:MAG: hypothetical protein LUG85_05450 [Clostridiales bacterium]|nr:hypothetical protein [Clostridiales bacterium]
MPADVIFRTKAFGGFNKEDVINYIEKLTTENAAVKQSLSEKDGEIASLKEEKARLEKELNNEKKRSEDAYIECEDKIAAMRENCQNEIDRIKAEAEESNTMQTAEEKVGAAMIDVRRYADMLIQETCDKIDTISDNADEATAKALSRILDISSGIQTFSDKLNGILKDILDENDNICQMLSTFKGTLKLPLDEASEKMEHEVFGK